MPSTINYQVQFLVLFIAGFANAQFLIPNLPEKQYIQLGDINLGGIFPIYDYDKYLPCGSSLRSTAIMQYIESMVFAVESVNNRTDILPNVTLGFAILDDCKKASTAMSQALHFVPRDWNTMSCDKGQSYVPPKALYVDNNDSYSEYFDVVGVVGSMQSSASVSVADILGVFHVPQISYSSTSDQLSNKAQYPYFLRVVAPDRFQIQTIVELIRHFKWTYISTVHSAGSYGETGINTLHSLTKKYGICIAADRQTHGASEERDYDDIIMDLLSHSNAKVVVVFTGPENAKGLFYSAKKLGAVGKFIWIGGDAWATRLSSIGEHQDGTLGGFTVKMFSDYVPEFNNYFRQLNFRKRKHNPWFVEFWEKQFGCSFSEGSPLCNEDGVIAEDGYMAMSSIAPVIDAVTTFAMGIHYLLVDNCPISVGREARDCITGPDLQSYLKHVTFEGVSGPVSFDQNGEFLGRYMVEQIQLENGGIVQKHVATWDAHTGAIQLDTSTVQWYLDENPMVPPQYSSASSVPESVCSKPCSAGEFLIQKEPSCCWDCRHCRDNEILNENGTSCLECPLFTWPEQTTFSTCKPIEPEVLKWSDALTLFLLVVMGSGCLGTITVLVFYIKHNTTRLIKASSRELSYLMLCGVMLGYLTVLGLVAPTGTWGKCTVVQFGFSLGFSGIYAPLLTRTNRIYRIFNAGKRSTKRPPFTSPRAQICIATIMISVQVALTIASILIEKPTPKLTMPVVTEKFVELSCDLPIYGLSAFLLYNLLLVLLCAVFAFKTRKLPDNFNESRFISMCVYTTLVIWLAFIPTYFTTAREFHKTILLSLALLINATVALVFLYLPKIYATIYVEDAGRTFTGVGTVTGSTVLGESINITKVRPMAQSDQ